MINAINRLVRSVPVVGPFLVTVKNGKFKGSADYWDGVTGEAETPARAAAIGWQSLRLTS